MYTFFGWEGKVGAMLFGTLQRFIVVEWNCHFQGMTNGIIKMIKEHFFPFIFKILFFPSDLFL